MSVPNYFSDVLAAKNNYADAWLHAHVSGDPRKGEWIMLLARDLRAKDNNVGANGKRGNPNDPSMDAINILCDAEDSNGRTPDGRPCVVVDVIGSAGARPPYSSSNREPFPTWQVHSTLIEGSGANVDPNGVTPNPHPPLPQSKVLPKAEAFERLKDLHAFYAHKDGLQRPEGIGGDMEAIAQWFYQMVIEGVPFEDVKKQIRDSHEWKSKHP